MFLFILYLFVLHMSEALLVNGLRVRSLFILSKDDLFSMQEITTMRAYKLYI